MSTLFDQSYQPWTGSLRPHAFRIPVIAWTGIRTVMKRHPVALLVLCGLCLLLDMLLMIGVLMQPLDPTMVVLTIFSLSLFTAYLFVVPFLCSGLVANDLRHNALLMYFSKSIFRVDYFVGKLVVPCVFVVPLILVPPMIAAVFILQPHMASVPNDYVMKLFLALIPASVVGAVPPVAVTMAFSSCTRRGWLGGVGWCILFLLLATVSGILVGAAKLHWGQFLSFSDNVSHVARAILPESPKFLLDRVPPMFRQATEERYSAWWSFLVLLGVTTASFAVVFWRLSKAERRT